MEGKIMYFGKRAAYIGWWAMVDLGDGRARGSNVGKFGV